MANFNSTTQSTYATTNWDSYHQGRPSYPQSLTKLILDHHRLHAEAKCDRLVDIGAGSGIAAANFMADFKTLHISDPSPWNEEQARTFLTQWAESHNLKPTLEYSVSTGKDAWRHAGEGQADLVICATAAHFMDGDELVESVAKILRPGGTLAVFSYWMPSFPDQAKEFEQKFEETFERVVLRPLSQSGDEESRERLRKTINNRMTGKGGLDSLPLPTDKYQDTRRVYINASDGKIPMTDLYQRFVGLDKKLGGESRVGAEDTLVHYRTGADAEADGWLFQVDKQWLYNFFNSVRPASSKESPESQQALAEWERVFDEACPSGQVRTLWPAYLCLATRK